MESTGRPRVFIALGANLEPPIHGPPRRALEAALEELSRRGVAIHRVSPWYRTAPVPASDQPWYVNAVAEVATDLTADARVQYFLFQQFLIVFLLMPITGAMALASHAVIGEKQARTLEPLLATPLTTAELLVAKALGALAPTLAISAASLAIYFGAIALFAEPGVMRAMIAPRTLLLVGFVGPAAALVALQVAIVVSARVNDARTAQQFGVLIIIPLTAVLIAQFTGALWLSATAMALIGLGLVGAWILLTLLSVALFERETILTRWR